MNKFLEAIKPTPSTYAIAIFVAILTMWNHHLKNKHVEIPVIDEALIYEEVKADMSPTEERAKSAVALATEASRQLDIQPAIYRLGTQGKTELYVRDDIEIPRPDFKDTYSYSLLDYGDDTMLWKLYADLLVTNEEISQELLRQFATDDFSILGIYQNNMFNDSDNTGFVAVVILNEQPVIINCYINENYDIYAFKVFH